MLGVVTLDGRGATDALLQRVASRAAALGLRVAGALQINTENPQGEKCHMDIDLLPSGPRIRISQNLGPMARGCRLDPDGLERAAGLCEREIEEGQPDLVIINKFGKQEADGQGFRGAIAAALVAQVPVLIGVSPGKTASFDAFAQGLSHELVPHEGPVLSWIAEQCAVAPRSE